MRNLFLNKSNFYASLIIAIIVLVVVRASRRMDDNQFTGRHAFKDILEVCMVNGKIVAPGEGVRVGYGQFRSSPTSDSKVPKTCLQVITGDCQDCICKCSENNTLKCQMLFPPSCAL